MHLWCQLEFKLATKILAFEFGILSNVRRYHALDLASLEQRSQAKVRNANRRISKIRNGP